MVAGCYHLTRRGRTIAFTVNESPLAAGTVGHGLLYYSPPWGIIHRNDLGRANACHRRRRRPLGSLPTLMVGVGNRRHASACEMGTKVGTHAGPRSANLLGDNPLISLAGVITYNADVTIKRAQPHASVQIPKSCGFHRPDDRRALSLPLSLPMIVTASATNAHAEQS
jgi:hypothetical protein